HARCPRLAEQAGRLPARDRTPPDLALGTVRRRVRPHRPQRQGPRRRRPLAAARAPAGGDRRRPRPRPAGLVSLRVFYGGTFAPVHAGHLAVAGAARDTLHAAVHLVPAAVPPHRGPTAASARDRADLLELAVAGESG